MLRRREAISLTTACLAHRSDFRLARRHGPHQRNACSTVPANPVIEFANDQAMTENDRQVRVAVQQQSQQTEDRREIERQKEIARQVMDEDRDLLRELAKR